MIRNHSHPQFEELEHAVHIARDKRDRAGDRPRCARGIRVGASTTRRRPLPEPSFLDAKQSNRVTGGSPFATQPGNGIRGGELDRRRARSETLKCRASPASRVRVIGPYRIPASSMPSMCTSPGSSEWLMIRAGSAEGWRWG